MRRPNKVKYKLEDRRTSALLRQGEYAKLSVSEKIAQLDKAFGKGKGAARQRAKLNK
jgi:hypothetical protein